MRMLFRHSLRGRFLVVTGLLYLGTTLALTSLHFYQARTSLLRELERRGNAITRNLVAESQRSLETNRPEMLVPVLEHSLDDGDGDDDDVRYVLVQDPSGRVLSQAATPDFDLGEIRPALVASAWNPSRPGFFKLTESSGKVIYNFSAPVWSARAPAEGPPAPAAERRLGTVRVGVCTAPTMERIEAAFRMNLMVGLLVCTLGIAVIAVMTRWTLKPLREMAEVARAISQGDLSRRVAGGSDGEIGSLGRALNDMTESLAAGQASLERRAEELEAAALEKERLYHEARVRAVRLRVLSELSQAMASTLQPDEIYAQVHRQLGRLMRYEYLTVLRYTPEGGQFSRDFVWLDRQDLRSNVREVIPGEMPLFTRIRETEQPRFSPDFQNDDLLADGWLARNGFRSGFLVPIMARGEFLGILGMAARRRNAFGRSEVTTVNSIAGNMGLVLKNADLYQRLQRSFVEIQRAQEQLAHSENTRRAEKLRSVGQMASGVAHDFNNVLASITGRVQLMRMKLERGRLEPDELVKSLGIMERAALDGAETVRRIQEFSRDREEIQRSRRADLNQLVREVVEITRPRWKTQAEQQGVRVEVLTELETVPQISCIPSEIREVLTNLIFNAVDAMPEGGQISLRTYVEDDAPCVSVRDTGAGIPAELRERIFEPFFTTKGVKGSGLGLSIVYGIVQRHGGRIGVHEAPGGGTEFRIQLVPADAAVEETPDEPVLVSRACRILVGDDEANVRQTLVDLLIALGHEVAEAGSGSEILNRFEAGRFDLVFTDLGMPDMSGWEVTRIIHEREPGVPVVLVTGWGNQISTREAADRGVTRVLAKPFTVQKVTSVIAEVQNLDRAA